MKTNKDIIAFYDSGIGGLTLLNKAVKSFSDYNFLYLGDNLNAPYGNKSREELIELAKLNVKTLISLGAKIITFACNTLSTTIFEDIKKDKLVISSGVTLTGVVPNKPSNDNYILLCTQNTANSSYVKNNFEKSKVLPLPFLAKEIERFIFFKDKIHYKLDLALIDKNVSEVILGCTHYNFIKNEIQNVFKNAVVTDGFNQALLDIKNALIGQKSTKTNNNRVTYDHFNNFLSLKVKNSKNTIFFIGNNAKYNKIVYSKIFKWLLFNKNSLFFIAKTKFFKKSYKKLLKVVASYQKMC